MSKFILLEWDTDVFGFAVAKIMPDRLSVGEMEIIFNDLKKRNVSLAYWASESRDKDSHSAAKSMGGFLTGQRITYVVDLRSMSTTFFSPAIQTKEYYEDKPNTDLTNLIFEGGVYSRFYTDPKITRKQYEDIHKLWIDNSVKNNTVFVIEENGRILGFVSLNTKNKRGNIDFIVVGRTFRGKGYGNALICAAHKWFISKGYDIVQAVTQKENAIACKMYERFGYHIEKIENFYHFWL